jgi:uncharacterized protein involved in type VI secretion and phage assembly
VNASEETARLLRDQVERHFGRYRGTVTSNADPKKLGRIRAKVPEVLGELESGWALPAAPMAGKNAGFFSVPAKDDHVWIEFEAGDTSRPTWVGAFWSDKQVPNGVEPVVRMWKTPAGHTIALDDSAGGEKLTISDAHGASIVLDQSGIEITKGSQKLKLTATSVSINDGALEVT